MMEDTPLISVVIAFLNEERFLKEAIESVLQQEYKHWEILLVDDGSSDKSSSIAKQYAAIHSGRIIYLEHEKHVNRGLSASRNLAIKNAKGKFVAFLDADDAWLPAFLKQKLKLMHQYNASLICEATTYWYSWNNPKRQDVKIQVGTEQERLYYPPQLLQNLYPLGKGAAPCVCGMLVKKDVLIKHGGFEESFTGMYEDQVFLSKFYLHEPVFISSECYNIYRQRSDSLVATSKLDNGYHYARHKFLNWLGQYIKQQGIQHAEVSRLLRKALYPYQHPKMFFLFRVLPRKILSKIKKLIPSTIKEPIKGFLKGKLLQVTHTAHR